MARPTRATYDFRREVEAYLAPGTYDSLRQPLYDRVIIPAGAVAAGTVFPFFAIPSGQAGKNNLDTNMNLAGQLPANHVMEVWSPRVVVRPVQPSNIVAIVATTVLTDVDNLIHQSFVNFTIVTQQKLLAPTYYLPAGFGTAFSGQVTLATANLEVATNGLPHQPSAQRLDPFPVIIPPLQTFAFTLSIGTVGFTAQQDIHVWVVLDGMLHRTALP